MSEKDEILDGLPEENDLQTFDLDEIMKEFGGGENPEEPMEPMPETETDEPDPEQLLQPDIPEIPAAEPGWEPEEQQPAQTPEVTGDTVRLDHLADALKEMVWVDLDMELKVNSQKMVLKTTYLMLEE